jgi:MFS family permease
MSISFYGIDKFHLGNKDYILANISIISSVAGIATVFIFGKIGDTIGHKLNLLLSSSFIMTSMLLVLLTHDLFWFMASFAFYSMGLICNIVSKNSIIMEFCRDADRPTYISTKNTIIALFSFSAPMMGAFITKSLGITVMLSAVIGMHTIYILVLAFLVKEPRNKNRGSVLQNNEWI